MMWISRPCFTSLKDKLKTKQDAMVGAAVLCVKCLKQEIQESRMSKEQLDRKRSCKKRNLDKRQL